MKTPQTPPRSGKGAILYMGKYGSTRQYADWMAKATGLPVVNLATDAVQLDELDYVILGSAVYVGRLALRSWLKEHWPQLSTKPVLLFSVSGSPAGHPDLEATLAQSLTPEMRRHLAYVPLRGRLDLQRLPWFWRLMLPLVGRLQKDLETRERMMHGFDRMDKTSIRPVLAWAKIQGVAEPVA